MSGPSLLLHALALATLGAGQEELVTTEPAAAERRAEVAALAARLAAPGPEAAPALLLALGRPAPEVEDGAALVVRELEEEAHAQAARALGRPAFLPHWSEAARSSDPDQRLGVIRLVELVGLSGDLRLAAEAARAPEGAAHDGRAAQALAQTLSALLARDSGTLLLLKPLLLSLPPELAGGLVHAASDFDDARVLALLIDCLRIDRRLELPLLGGIARAARLRGPPFDERLCGEIRPYLRHADRQTARTAVEAVGCLEDASAVPHLLELAGASDRGLSSAAFAALRQVTLLKLPERIERWRAWFLAESRWEEERVPILLQQLQGETPALTCAALRELQAHPLRRAQISRRLIGLLRHQDEGVRQAAQRLAQSYGPGYATPGVP